MLKNCLIIAHRGESFDAPENTLAAVNLAWERGADAVEIDVQLSKDNKIVVIHDENTKRTGGRNKLVKNQTLKELKELDVGIYRDKKSISIRRWIDLERETGRYRTSANFARSNDETR